MLVLLRLLLRLLLWCCRRLSVSLHLRTVICLVLLLLLLQALLLQGLLLRLIRRVWLL